MTSCLAFRRRIAVTHGGVRSRAESPLNESPTCSEPEKCWSPLPRTHPSDRCATSSNARQSGCSTRARATSRFNAAGGMEPIEVLEQKIEVPNHAGGNGLDRDCVELPRF